MSNPIHPLVTVLVMDHGMTKDLRNIVGGDIQSGDLPMLRGIAVEEALNRTLDRADLPAEEVVKDVDIPQDALELIVQAVVTASPTYGESDTPTARWEAQQRYGRTLQEMITVLQRAHGEGLFLQAGQYTTLTLLLQRLDSIIRAPRPIRFGEVRNQMQLNVNVEGDRIVATVDRVMDPDKP